MSTSREYEHGLPEWIMSYADMITILMAFFVVMYSMAPTGKITAKQEAFLESLRAQFGTRWEETSVLEPSLQSPLPNLAAIELQKRRAAAKDQNSKKHPSIENHQPAIVRPVQQPNVGGTVYFDDDSIEINPAQQRVLNRVIDDLGGKLLRLEVRGHTSQWIPADAAKFRDNWDLSYERARKVMDYLVNAGIDPKRIRLAVAADNEPVVSSVVAVGQSARVEICLLNEMAAAAITPKEH